MCVLVCVSVCECVSVCLCLFVSVCLCASSMSENNDEDDDDEGGDDGHHQVTSTLRNAQHVPGCQIQSQVSFLKCFFGVPLLATHVSFFLNKRG